MHPFNEFLDESKAYMTKGLGLDGLDSALGRRGCQILQHLPCQESPSALLGSIHNLGKHTVLSACNRNIPGNGGFSCLFMFYHFDFLPVAWTYTFFSINRNHSLIMGEKHADHTKLWLTRNTSCSTLKNRQKAKSRHAYKHPPPSYHHGLLAGKNWAGGWRCW